MAYVVEDSNNSPPSCGCPIVLDTFLPLLECPNGIFLLALHLIPQDFLEIYLND